MRRPATMIQAEDFFDALQVANEMKRRIELIVPKLISFLNYNLFLKEWVARDPVNGPKEIIREGDHGCRIGLSKGVIVIDFVKFTDSGHEMLFSSDASVCSIPDQHLNDVYRLLTPLIAKMADRFHQHGFTAKVKAMMISSVTPGGQSGWKG